MNRITRKNLEALVDVINKETGSPATSWTRHADGTLTANIGNYHISGAYGGYSLQRICSAGGGVSDVVSSGHIKARDLYERMHAFLAGWRAHKLQASN